MPPCLAVPLLTVAVTAALAAAQRNAPEHNYVPPGGYVPDAATAVAVARAVLLPVYGKAAIAGEEPLSATLSSNAWTVVGTLPKGYAGGSALLRVSKKIGAILRMTHGK